MTDHRLPRIQPVWLEVPPGEPEGDLHADEADHAHVPDAIHPATGNPMYRALLWLPPRRGRTRR